MGAKANQSNSKGIDKGNSNSTGTKDKNTEGRGQAGGKGNGTNSTGEINLGSNLERIETEVPSPDIVEVEIPQTEKRGRGRPPGSGGKKSPSTSKADNQPIMLNENDLSQVIQGVFGLIAVPLGSHWNISKPEADNVAKPLNRILHRLDWTKSAGKYSDGVLLTLAGISIVMPRTIITMQQRKVKLKPVEERRNISEPTNNQERKSVEVSGNDPKSNQQSNGGYGNSLLDQLSPVM